MTAFVFDSLPSTQTEAVALARDGVPDGSYVYARTQTEGRGRHGRTWLSGPGSLCFSFIRSRGVVAETAFHWSFVAAVAIADFLDLRIKWPNDLYRNGKKVGGILATLEMEPCPTAIIGVGLNLTFVPAGLEARAGALGQERPNLLPELLGAIEQESSWYLTTGGALGLAAKVRQRLAFVGEKVQVVAQSGTVVGMLQGIDDAFQLLLVDEQGKPLIVSAAEVWPLE